MNVISIDWLLECKDTHNNIILLYFYYSFHWHKVTSTYPCQFPLKNQVTLVQFFCSFLGSTNPPKKVQMGRF